MPLSVVLSNTAGVPIYEQIAQQVRDAILTGQVEADEMLPSIRALARIEGSISSASTWPVRIASLTCWAICS